MHDLPEGTLGWEYVEFYRRNGLTLPGDDPSMPAVFVGHDMCHVIGGYEPTGQGEIALGAMQLAVTDSDAHWIGFLGNLAVHEAGYLTNESVTGVRATMTRTHAPELVAQAMWRGSQCTGDFTTADHLSMIEDPLLEVRERFGVLPPDPDDPSVRHVRE
jgi:ubiquinone biosynthesis protein Coq4